MKGWHMKSLVIYDSAYGNTAKVAESIKHALSQVGSAVTKLVGEVKSSDWENLDLIVIGTPTQGGRPTKPIEQFIDEIPKEILNSTKAAVFDTRFDIQDQKFGLRLLMKTIGYAAPKMASRLKERGADVISEPKGFIVNDKEGPLRQGELERAGNWAVSLAHTAHE
jgi:flavodoxin